MLARKKAQLQGFDDALFANNGLVTEGPAWNIFFVKGQALITPPVRDGLLPGIARKLVLESATSLGMSAQQRSISERDVPRFDGAFVTNCITGLQEVKSVGDMVFKSSGFTGELQQAYAQLQPVEV
jgi:branched-subunit amino acid aminotransferase/4-amino-4-deoxychorismate lyase